MTTDQTRPIVVLLTAAGVSLAVDVSDGALPQVVHWGPALESLTAASLPALVATGEPLTAPNDVDVPVRVSVLPELTRGWTGRPGLEGSREGRSWSTRFTVEDVTLDGEPVTGCVVAGAGLLVVRATDAEAGLGLVVDLGLDPTGLVRVRAAVTNEQDDVFTVDALTPSLPVPSGADELLDFGGRWGRERSPQRQPLHTGIHLRENRKGRTGADSAYVLHAGTPGFGFGHGDVYAVHTAWSGNHVHLAERAFSGQRLLGGGELLMSGEVRLGRAETYTTPWLYGSHGQGLDAVAHRFHRHLRSRARPVGTDRPVTLNVWEAVYFDHALERLEALADRAAKVGVERYVLDDGWFGGRRHDSAGLGDWVVSDEAWPDGLHPIVDHVRGLGMEFGLWFEPEMVNADSDVVRAHPEWVMAARREWPVESRQQQVIDLAVPGAYEHVKGQILAILDEYDIGYLKWDHNRDLHEAGNQLDGGRPAVHAQTEAVYRLLDEIRAAHPGLEIESCSSGGARVDLAVLERTDRVWVSDVIDPLERQHMLRWTTQLVPPEFLGSHIASGHSHSTGRMHHLSFRAGTALFGHLGIEWDLTAVGSDVLDDLAAWTALYRDLRGLLLSGDLVRMDSGEENLFVHGVVAPDGRDALFAMATVGSLLHVPGPRIRFRGLDPATAYRVRPVVVGEPPSGLVAPAWWGEPEGVEARPRDPMRPGRTVQRGARYAGATLTGEALALVGVTPPLVDPDQVVLFRVTAEA